MVSQPMVAALEEQLNQEQERMNHYIADAKYHSKHLDSVNERRTKSAIKISAFQEAIRLLKEVE